MKKVLIITYYWPPSGGAGVQRWLRFSKYLPQLGWEPVILTVDPGYAAYPALDSSLENDVQQGLTVYRTKATDWFRVYSSDKSKIPSAGFAKNNNNSLKEKLFRFIRGNFFIPDPRKGWNKHAYRKACEIIETAGIKHVITTSPPHSTQLIGLRIKHKYPDLRWIADLRDPWTDIYYYKQFYPTFLSKKIDLWYETRVLERSDLIITVGPSLKRSFSKKITGNPDKIRVITNGFDEDDFKNISPVQAARFTITYVGTLSDKYPIGEFLGVLAKIRKNGIDILLRFVGSVPENIQKKIVAEFLNGSTEFIPYTNHDEAIRFMINSSMLLLVIPEHKNNQNITTGKIFEYIASGKPVLCLGPKDGDAAAVLAYTGSGECYDYTETGAMESFILQIMANPCRTQSRTGEFSHRNIAEKLVSFLEKPGV